MITACPTNSLERYIFFGHKLFNSLKTKRGVMNDSRRAEAKRKIVEEKRWSLYLGEGGKGHLC
jgi:hypothetical protein